MICYSGIDNQNNAQTKNLNIISPKIFVLIFYIQL